MVGAEFNFSHELVFLAEFRFFNVEQLSTTYQFFYVAESTTLIKPLYFDVAPFNPARYGLSWVILSTRAMVFS